MKGIMKHQKIVCINQEDVYCPPTGWHIVSISAATGLDANYNNRVGVCFIFIEED